MKLPDCWSCGIQFDPESTDLSSEFAAGFFFDPSQLFLSFLSLREAKNLTGGFKLTRWFQTIISNIIKHLSPLTTINHHQTTIFPPANLGPLKFHPSQGFKQSVCRSKLWPSDLDGRKKRVLQRNSYKSRRHDINKKTSHNYMYIYIYICVYQLSPKKKLNLCLLLVQENGWTRAMGRAFFLAFSMVKDEAWPKSSGMPCRSVDPGWSPMGISWECDIYIYRERERVHTCIYNYIYIYMIIYD